MITDHDDRRQHQLPASPLLIDGCSVNPVRSARDLGIHIGSDLSMRTHVKRTVSRCFGALHCDNSVRFAVRFRLLHFRCWWSRWYTAYWTYQRRTGWPTGLPDAPVTVCTQRSSASYLRPEDARPHH